jgi:hypothetical protein
MARPKRGETRAPKPDRKDTIPEIIDWIASGNSLRSICQREGFPPLSTFLRWVSQDEELEKRYAAAMQMRADIHHEEMFDIAADASKDFVDLVDDETGECRKVANPNAIRRAQLEIDVRKWSLSRMNPKKYGDKVDLNHGGKVKVVQLDADDENI